MAEARMPPRPKANASTRSACSLSCACPRNDESHRTEGSNQSRSTRQTRSRKRTRNLWPTRAKARKTGLPRLCWPPVPHAMQHVANSEIMRQNRRAGSLGQDNARLPGACRPGQPAYRSAHNHAHALMYTDKLFRIEPPSNRDPTCCLALSTTLAKSGIVKSSRFLCDIFTSPPPRRTQPPRCGRDPGSGRARHGSVRRRP